MPFPSILTTPLLLLGLGEPRIQSKSAENKHEKNKQLIVVVVVVLKIWDYNTTRLIKTIQPSFDTKVSHLITISVIKYYVNDLSHDAVGVLPSLDEQAPSIGRRVPAKYCIHHWHQKEPGMKIKCFMCFLLLFFNTWTHYRSLGLCQDSRMVYMELSTTRKTASLWLLLLGTCASWQPGRSRDSKCCI